MLLGLADYTTPLLDKKFGTKSTLNEKLKEAALQDVSCPSLSTLLLVVACPLSGDTGADEA